MDGLDGLVALCMIVVITFSFLNLNVQPIQWVIVGSLGTFIFFNWNPAKVFMGDIGSTFLGAFFTGLALQATSFVQFIEIILISSPVLGDALICVIRRGINKQPIFKPHKLHLYQRLNQAGLSHSNVTLIYMLTTLCIGVGTTFGGIKLSLLIILFELLIFFLLEKYIATPFKKASTFIDN